jgi:hypothetical protein
LEIEDPAAEESTEVDVNGERLFKEDGVEIVHKPSKNWQDDKEEQKMREKLAIQKEKHRIYNKLLTAEKGLGDSDEEETGGVDNFVEKMRLQAQKKAQQFDDMDEDAEKEAVKQPKPKRKPKSREAITSGLVVGHSKEAFLDGTETVLVLQDKSKLPSLFFKRNNFQMFLTRIPKRH